MKEGQIIERTPSGDEEADEMLFVYGGAVLRSESCLYSLSGYIQIIERTPSGDEEADEMLFVYGPEILRSESCLYSLSSYI